MRTVVFSLLALVVPMACVLGWLLYTYHSAQPLAVGTADRVEVDKSARTLALYSGDQRLATYSIALGRDPIGHKQREGDSRTPEGAYTLDWRNEQSKFYRSLHISYPNVRDRRRAQSAGVSPGGEIMIHGQRNGYGFLAPLMQRFDWTDGCIAVTDREMEEIWRAVPVGTRIEIRP